MDFEERTLRTQGALLEDVDFVHVKDQSSVLVFSLENCALFGVSQDFFLKCSQETGWGSKPCFEGWPRDLGLLSLEGGGHASTIQRSEEQLVVGGLDEFRIS